MFEGAHDILVGGNIQKEDVPIGTEVWFVENPLYKTKDLVQKLKLQDNA